MKTEIIPITSIELITKAEIDIQISTAKAFPREIKRSISNALEIATISQEVAESCTYTLPRGSKVIDGPSVRLAEIVVSTFGNIRSAARIISNDGKTITAQGICHDLETNNSVTVEVRRKITNNQGVTFSEDMQVVTGNAACAIAYRNAVFKVIPASLVDPIYKKVKEVSKGDGATLSKRRITAMTWFASKGIEASRVLSHLKCKSVEDINLNILAKLTGYRSAIINDGADISEIFKELKEVVNAKGFEKIKEGVSLKLTTTKAASEQYELTTNQMAILQELEKSANS